MKKIFDLIFSAVFPNRCVGCDELLSYGKERWVCSNCTPYFDVDKSCQLKRCQICGRIIYHNGNCRVCNSEKRYFDKGYTVFEYKGMVRDAIRRFKYRGLFSYAKFMGGLMADYAEKNITDKFDIVTGVPLHKKRQKQRGYNQSEIMGKIVAKRLGVEYKNVLVRKINTAPQNSLGKKERAENIKAAFDISKKANVKDKNILIIDDIFTTGSTINECSKILKRNGACSVKFFALSCRGED